MDIIIKFFATIGIFLSFLTPLTFTIGIINAIRKPEEEAKQYVFIAVISAYLIIMPLFYVVLRS